MLRTSLFLAFAGFNGRLFLVLIRFIFARLDELRDPEERRRALREFVLDETGHRVLQRFPGMGNPLQQIFVTLLAMAGLRWRTTSRSLRCGPSCSGAGPPRHERHGPQEARMSDSTPSPSRPMVMRRIGDHWRGMVAVVGLGLALVSPCTGQVRDSLPPGSTVRVTPIDSSRYAATLMAAWAPDSLRLRRFAFSEPEILRWDGLSHLDVRDGHHGGTGALVGLVAAGVAGVVLGPPWVSTLSEGNAEAHEYALGSVAVAGFAALITVPVVGVVGSAVPRWRRIF